MLVFLPKERVMRGEAGENSGRVEPGELGDETERGDCAPGGAMGDGTSCWGAGVLSAVSRTERREARLQAGWSA